jgi:hypothetical protein
MERFEFQLGLTNMVVVKAEGQGGGIAVNVRNCMGNHIDMDVKDVRMPLWGGSPASTEPRSEWKHRK